MFSMPSLRLLPVALLLSLAGAFAQPIPQSSLPVRTVTPALPAMRAAPTGPSDPYWKFATPASQRIDPARLEAAIDFIRSKNHEIHGLVVARHGVIVFERYGWKTGRNGDDPDKSQHWVSPSERHLVHSTTKSFTSALTGIAIHEGLIPAGVNARAVSFFPDWQPFENPSKEKDSIRLADILTMRSGLKYQEGPDDIPIFFEPASSARAMLNRPVVDLPVGQKWNYSSGGTGILTAILQKVTKRDVRAYAQDRLLTPLGIMNPPWEGDKSGVPHGGWGLALTPREMARFGELYRLNGLWQGKQIVPAAWVAESVKPHSETPWSGHYGYQWWIPARVKDCFMTRGAYGQDVYVLPKLGLVVAFTADLPIAQADATLDTIMNDFILPAVQP